MAGLIVVSPNEENIGFSTGDELAVGSFHDIENDVLYFTDGSTIFEWEGDDTSQQTYTWKSGQIRLAKNVNLGAALVEADSYSNLTFRLYARIGNAMVLKHTETVSDSEPFRLPGGYLANIYEVELEGTDSVTKFSVGENIWELAEG